MGHVFKYKDNWELGLYFERVVTQSIILKKEPVCFTLVPGHRNQNAESEQIYIWKKRCRYLKVLIANMCFHKRIWKAGTPFSCNKVILCHQQVPCVIACTILLNFWKFHTCMQWRMIISTPFPPSHFSQLPFNMPSLNFMSFFFLDNCMGLPVVTSSKRMIFLLPTTVCYQETSPERGMAWKWSNHSMLGLSSDSHR